MIRDAAARKSGPKRSQSAAALQSDGPDAHDPAGARRLKRTPSAANLMSLGIGATIGAGIFVVPGPIARLPMSHLPLSPSRQPSSPRFSFPLTLLFPLPYYDFHFRGIIRISYRGCGGTGRREGLKNL